MMEPEKADDAEGSQEEQSTGAQSGDGVDERSKLFVKYFVKEFEEKLVQSFRDTKPGKLTQRAGKTADQICSVTSLVEPAVKIPVIKKVVKTVGRKCVREVEKNFLTAIDSLLDNKDERKKIEAEAGFEIFRSFEMSFSGITDENRSSRRGMEKLAIVAVGRIRGYVARNTKVTLSTSNIFTKMVNIAVSKMMGYGERNTDVTLSTSDLLTEAIIRGESEDDHTVKFKGRDELIKCNEIFSKTGIKKEDGVYYKKGGDDVQKYGYRLAFKWELEKWESELKDKYKKCEGSVQEYTYIMKAEARDEFVTAIVKNMVEVEGETKRGFYAFEVTDPVGSFTGRQEELDKLRNMVQQSSEKYEVLSRMILIHGMGGIGKTQLVRKFILNFGRSDFDNILWMNAENDEALSLSFRELAAREGLYNFENDSKLSEKDVMVVVKKVYQHFAQGRSLFVLDNVEEYSILLTQDKSQMKFLPSSLIAYKHKPYFIVTSRSRHGPERIVKLQLKVFNETDAIKFISKELNEDENYDMMKLADELQHYPLGLGQAVAYIKESRKGSEFVTVKFGIIDYLKIFEKKTKEVLKFNSEFEDYEKTTLTTWLITFDKMSGPALDILNIIAYTAPDNIPSKLFWGLESINDDERKLREALNLLAQYSMVDSGEQESINIHRLVQAVTRIKLLEEKRNDKRNDKILETTFELLVKCYPEDSYEIKDREWKRRLLPHLEVLREHINDLLSKRPAGENEILSEYIWKITCLMFEANRTKCTQFMKEVMVLKRAVEKLMLSFDNEGLISTLMATNINLDRLGDYQKRKESPEKVLAMSVDNILESLGLTNEAYFENLYAQMKKLVEDALAIMKKKVLDTHLLTEEMAEANVTLAELKALQKPRDIIDRIVLFLHRIDFKGYPETSLIVDLGNVHHVLGETQRQIEVQKAALDFYCKTPFFQMRVPVAVALYDLSTAHLSMGNPHKAIDLLQEALQIYEILLASDGVCSTRDKLGNAYCSLGDFPRGKELHETVLKIKEELHGPNDFRVASSLIYLGSCHGYMENYQEAIEIEERALAILKEHCRPDNKLFALVYILLSNAYSSLGNYDKMKEFFEHALEIQKKHYDPDNFETPHTPLGLSIVCNYSGNSEEQVELLERALTIEKEHRGLVVHKSLRDALRNLAIAHGNSGEYNKAYKLYEILSKLTATHTPLQLAAEIGNLGIVEYIRENGADILERNVHHTVLHCAARNTNAHVLSRILTKTEEKDPQNFLEHLNAMDDNGRTPLAVAAIAENVYAALILLQYGANPNIQNNDDVQQSNVVIS